MRAAYSYLASNDPRVHVGLGQSTTADERDCSVAGRRHAETFGDMPGDRIAVLRRGAGRK